MSLSKLLVTPILVFSIIVPLVNVACTETDPRELVTATSTSPASQASATETSSDTAEQPTPVEATQRAETDLPSTPTPEPEATATLDSDETSTPPSEQEATPEATEEAPAFAETKFGDTKIEPFSSSSWSQTPPEDVLAEISFSSGAGGGAACTNVNGYEQPTIVFTPEEALLHELITVNTCGWEVDESVEITLTYPNGSAIIEEQVYDGEWSNGELIFEFKTDVLTDPAGQYAITLSGSEHTLQHQIELKASDGPQIYWEDNDDLILFNFEPNETVRVFAYTGEAGPTGMGTAQLNAWQAFNVNQQGNLILQLPEIPGNWFAAIGDISGEVSIDHHSSPRVYGTSAGSILASDAAPTPTETWPISNTGVEACRLRINGSATAAENARLWSQPDVTSGSATHYLSPGQQLSIVAGPQWGRIRVDIDASGWWWQVGASTNESGWLWQERIAECTSE